jgi:hypothetical protein
VTNLVVADKSLPKPVFGFPPVVPNPQAPSAKIY